MFTQCPECETFFRVAAEDLEVAAGRVRCSQCDAVFDARAHLHADDDPEVVSEGAVTERGPDDLFAALQGEVALGDADLPLPPADSTLAHDLAAPAASDGPLADDPSLDQPGADDAATPSEADAPFVFPDDLPPLPVAGRRRSALTDRLWSAAVVLLALGLAAQWVHAERRTLAEAPHLGPLVRDAYAALDRPLERPRDLSRISVQRSEVTTHPLYEQVLMLSGVLENDAPFAQDFPLLRVRLDDRWGELVGYRLFEPREYLRRPPAAGARLEPAQSYAIALEVVDPGSEAVGYAIEPCLRLGDGIECTGASPR